MVFQQRDMDWHWESTCRQTLPPQCLKLHRALYNSQMNNVFEGQKHISHCNRCLYWAKCKAQHRRSNETGNNTESMVIFVVQYTLKPTSDGNDASDRTTPVNSMRYQFSGALRWLRKWQDNHCRCNRYYVHQQNATINRIVIASASHMYFHWYNTKCQT